MNEQRLSYLNENKYSNQQTYEKLAYAEQYIDQFLNKPNY
jgi:hypothetical protein